MWAMGQALALSLLLDRPWAPPPADAMGSNPLSADLPDGDGRIALVHLPAGRPSTGRSLCEAIGRPELATDPRFADHASLMANNREAIRRCCDEVFAGATLAEWRERLADFSGQWAVVQDTLEAAVDPQTVANGYVQDCETAAGVPFQLAAAPVQFDGQPAVPGRAPELNEHGDAILEELGFDWDTIVDLKVRGVVA